LRLSGTYQVKKWEEKPYDVFENRMKATRASVEYYFTGDIEGAANVEYLMFYKSFDPQDPHKAEAQYVGLIKIIGKLKGKPGTFVLADSGQLPFRDRNIKTYDSSRFRDWRAVENSRNGKLQGRSDKLSLGNGRDSVTSLL
jgi:hypothetical protein